MRVLIIDVASNALDFAMRCQDAGHEVIWYDRPRKDGSIRLAGKGIVPKLIDYDLLRSKYLDWADLIFLPDNTYYVEPLESYRKNGYPIFGCCAEASQWELNRTVGQKVLKAAGINTIPGIEFHDYDEAAKFVQKHPTYLVSKPNGDGDRDMSYVGPNPAAMVYMFERWKKNDKYRAAARADGFILQERKYGIEFAVGGWFGPSGWAKYWFENFENKKLMNGDLGPTTGEQGNLGMVVTESKLADIALKPLTKALRAIDYVGLIDVSGMVDDAGDFFPFEFTCRPPWPGFHNMMALTEGDPAQWMLDLLMGRDTMSMRENEACVSVVLAIPDYPYSHTTQKEICGIPVYNAGDRDRVHLSDVMLADDVPVDVSGSVVRMPHYVTSGDYVAVICGCGDTITGARRSAYAAIKKIEMPANPFFRTDIGSGRVVKGLPVLQEHGFAKNFKFV